MRINILIIFACLILKAYTFLIGGKKQYKTTPEAYHIINWSHSADELRNITLLKIDEEKALFEEIEALDDSKCTFDSVIVPLIRKVENEMTYYSYYLYLLENVAPEKEIRKVSSECYSKIEEFNYANFWNNEKIYQKIAKVNENIKKRKAKAPKNAEDKRLLSKLLGEFESTGFSLSEKDSETLMELDMKIGDLEYAFTDCIYEDETTVTFTKEELEGIPENTLKNFEQTTVDGKEAYILDTTSASLRAVSQLAKKDETRKKMSLVAGQRCEGNLDLLKQAVNLRYQKAKLLGYDKYSQLKLKNKMAANPDNVFQFLDSLKEKLQPVAKKELEKLLELKKEEKAELNEPFDGVIYDWDLEYYKRILVQREYTIDEAKIKEYFPIDQVIKEIFNIYEDVLSLKFIEIENPSVWHPDVRQIEVYDKSSKKFMGTLYLDLYPRQGKYNHIANYSVDYGYDKEDGSRNYSIAAMVANFPKPVDGSQTLLTHKEVINFFHELGHAFHQICSETKWSRFNGMNVEEDFVEGPSQMLEYFVWEPQIIKRISHHYETGEKLSDDLINSLVKTKNVNAGINNLKQLLYAYADMKIHSIDKEEPDMDLYTLWDDLKKDITLIEPNGTWPIAVFDHIMSGYDVNYYGYLWSQVYAADIFSVFKLYGVTNSWIGKRYRKLVLKNGSTKDSMDLLKRFLLRKPNDKAFLKYLGF